jgi:hypothetical protein
VKSVGLKRGQKKLLSFFFSEKKGKGYKKISYLKKRVFLLGVKDEGNLTKDFFFEI